MHNAASKDTSSQHVSPKIFGEPSEGQMPIPSFSPSNDSMCTARRCHHKYFTTFLSGERKLKLATY